MPDETGTVTVAGMTKRGPAMLTALVLGAVTALGCGIGSAKNIAPTATVLAEFADRLSHGRQSTYTATYDVPDGERVTLVREPRRAAFLTQRGRFVFTAGHLVRCAGNTCHRTPNQQPDLDTTTSGLAAEVTGPGFLTAEDALAVVAAAALVPGAKVKPSTRTIAGQEAVCGDVTGLAAANPPGQEPLRDFSVCVTDAGVLASFRGTLDNGRAVAVELTSVGQAADPVAFSVPAGTAVIDVAALPAG